MTPLEIEFVKTGLNLGVAVITLALGWFVGQRLTVAWNLKQKHQEQDLASAQEFHRLYGEFFAVWKLWNELKNHPLSVEGLMRKDVFVRACAAEGAVESLLVRVATNLILPPERIDSLGKFRQAYQSLRETIRDDKPLSWNRSDHARYTAFKILASEVSATILAGRKGPRNLESKAANLLNITSNAYEGQWYQREA